MTAFLRNQWYVACTADELGDKPLARRICNQKLVFYRTAAGQACALEDFCPHRGAPLSLGQVEGDLLVCGYHGLRVTCNGDVHSLPNQRVDRFPCVRRYAVVERGGFVWVWPGPAEQADEALLPHLAWADNPDWGYGGGLYHIRCDYRLMIDNLMDLTHETYVHADSIGQLEIEEAPVHTSVRGNEVITERHMADVTAPPFWQMALRENGLDPEARVDRWQICRFTPPSHVMIEVGVALAGRGGYDADHADKVSSIVVDFITPETDTSIWYFWGMARTFRPASAELTEKIREGQGKIFAEDLEMLEQQQQNLLEFPERPLMTVKIDAGGAQSRRVLQNLLAQEGPALEC
ncbi:aromatic ring-hydroxylating dioxygenase subunit alpha [Parahaliea maris]|uniref:Aromatic ring-hydroxylating dioxygenase subunit alpha n=1 Tax=Parahaliea maris TaxID=2716870 RepID=A0A5C8ZSB7_9GAMM|nr:aromatic ring-hydroxylating dioxygenase subunit alpha [Parahaliea maris]TXS90251.1 aromatic ring-hydroxylating dioxygenase subunit alpha [Parahaliea maris]